jgi:pantoate--beta-alanine ligase
MSAATLVDIAEPLRRLDERLTVVTTVAEFGDRLEGARSSGLTVGLVPTMGALHDGHRSLVERAAVECDLVAVTVFVNPLQFGHPDDLDHYPRTLEADTVVVGDAGGHILFAPALTEMYPNFPEPVPTSVGVSGVSEGWEGASRPGHFDGVSTVVTKLFAMAGRCRAYFGEKDFQQLAVVRRMAHDLSFPSRSSAAPRCETRTGWLSPVATSGSPPASAAPPLCSTDPSGWARRQSVLVSRASRPSKPPWRGS